MQTEGRKEPQVPEGIAIIGMAGRFPGADSVEQFWNKLCGGAESITFFTDEERRTAGVPSELLHDPQHQRFLELAWEAFENAGYHAERSDGQISVYAGAGRATRVSYTLNLNVPSMSIQSACQSLLGGKSDMVLAGSVTDGVPVDAASTGAGAVVLKRHADAIADGDTICAVIHGSAVNNHNDGSNKMTCPAPSVEGQIVFAMELKAEKAVCSQGERMEAQLDYWRGKLCGELPVLQLPTDRPRPAVHSYRGQAKLFTLSDTLTHKLNELSQKHGVTLYMTMMAAFKTLLFRYTGQRDLLVGTPSGFFVNTLVLRTELSDQLTFAELLTRVRDGAMEMYRHQEVPFERLVEELQPERNMGSTPFFQVIFGLQNGLEIDNATSKFDMTLMMTERGVQLSGQLEYNADLFDAATIERFTSHYETLLTAIVDDPEQKLWELSLLSDAERQQLLVEWNNTAVAFPELICLHHLFEEQAVRTPQNIAVVDGDRTLTYAELDAEANRLAHHLQEFGVTADAPVGMLIDRSAEMVVALLAILKAGGAYVPLDTEAPPARVEQVLTEAQAIVCLTQEHLQAKIPAAVNAVVLSAEGMAGLSAYPVTAPETDVTSDHLVSIYYTSGSTGKPKGVASTHQGWVNRMCWMQNQHGLQATESVLQKTTLTFDDAAVEFFWPLMVGARIVMLEPGQHKDPRAIIDAAVAHQAAVLQFVPTMLALVVDALTPQDIAGLGQLRLVVSSGEALRSDLVRLFDDKLNLHRVHLTNTWGATEVSIDSTIHTCTPQDGRGAEIVSVGRPIDNNKVYILDAHLSPVPIGVAGDLYLGGVGLARNYLNNPERTFEAFLLNPFCSGERMYKTGDRGYYRPDGSIMFLGRTDDQIKVRGQRVELGEIEAVLASHSGVKHCAVAAHKRPDGYALHGYYLAKGDAVPEPVLRAYLAERLPEYMVPKRIVALDELPFTVSGKVDRKLLPDPGDARPELLTSFVQAASAVEEVIAGIWAQILGVEEVGVHDKFFDLGGHSLDATRIISRINKEIGVRLPLRTLFEAPTVAGLAQAVEELMSDGASVHDAPIARLPEQERYELSNAQKRLWLEFQMTDGHHLGFTFPQRLLGNLDVTALQRAFQEVAARHSVMRTTYGEQDGDPFQIVHKDLEIPFHYEDLTIYPHGEREALLADRVAEVAKQSRYNLRQGPLFRMFLYKVDASEHLAMLSLHHIGYDGWSHSVMMEDLAALYRACKSGEPADLPFPVQYVDFAAWQNQRLKSGALDGQKEFWLQQLHGFTERPQLPGADRVPQEARALSAVNSHVLPAELTAKLRKLAAEQGTTLYVTALSAFKIWLAHVSGQGDLTIGSPTSGRLHQDLEGVMGVLVNPVVIRTLLDDNPTGLQVLGRVNRSAMQAYAHQEYPFDFVVNDLRREQELTGALYSIIFVGQNTSTEIALDDDVTVEVTWLENILPEEKLAQLNFAADLAQGDFDLQIEVYEAEKELLLRTQFNAARFRTETVEEFMRQYESMLDQFTQEPEKRLSQFELQLPDMIDELF
ncbi:non-ribosomal peptide synthetase [Tumebacillus avium]|nr:non-ribosomal peptide synthetase [Tumebacillus avium]